MTNADVIRAMSDDELADYLLELIYPDLSEPLTAARYMVIWNFLKKEACENNGKRREILRNLHLQ